MLFHLRPESRAEVLALQVARVRWTAPVLALAVATGTLAARGAPPAPAVVRGPIVSFSRQGPTIAVTVAPATTGLHVLARWKGASGPETRDLPIAGGKLERVELGAVPPSTAVAYDVRAGEASLAKGTLDTLPARGTPFVFCALGDSGEEHKGGETANDEQRAVAKALEAAKPAVVVHTGDVIYPRGQASGLDPLFFEPYAATLARVPFFCCLGNHDVRSDEGRPELESFPHPPNENADRYYSFDAGDVHFVVLDSNEALDDTKFPQTRQARWLDADLASARAPWKVAVLHHPLYSAPITRVWELESVRASLEKRLHDGGVDLVLCGHDHFYYRTHRLLGGARDDKGMVHVVTGGGGASLYPATKGDETAASATRYHFVRGSVEGKRLVLEALGPTRSGECETFDSAVLEKGKVWR